MAQTAPNLTAHLRFNHNAQKMSERWRLRIATNNSSQELFCEKVSFSCKTITTENEVPSPQAEGGVEVKWHITSIDAKSIVTSVGEHGGLVIHVQ